MRLGDALMLSGFRDPVLDGEHFTLTYADAPALMRDLKAIGATNAEHDRARGLTGKAHFAAVSKAYEAFRRDGLLPATYEVLYAHAWGPPPGQPRRQGGEEIATFPVDKLRIRRREG
jgi:malonyl-CoA O-methyltransferase